MVRWLIKAILKILISLPKEVCVKWNRYVKAEFHFGSRSDIHIQIDTQIQFVITDLGVVTVGVLFTIYFLNLDMKLVGWLYTVLNKFHDRKPRDVQF